MKKLSFLLIAALLLGVTACQKDSPKKSDELTVEPTLTFEGNGGRLEVAVASDYEWQFEGNPDWLTIEPFLDRTGFYATAAPHGEDTGREATITLTNGKTEQKITVTQGVVEWYDFVQSRVTLENPVTALLPGNAKDNDLAFQQFYFFGAETNSAFIPQEDSYQLAVTTVTTWFPGIDDEGTDIKIIDLPTGTYKYSLGGEDAHAELPSINGTGEEGQYNNYTRFVTKQGAMQGGYNDFGMGSYMTLEKEGDQYRMTCYLVSKQDGTIFKGRYTGELKMFNPYNTGLAEDWDFGTISSSGSGSAVATSKAYLSAYGMVLYGVRIVGEGLSRENGFAPKEGSGIYITGEGGMKTTGEGYMLADGTYTIHPELNTLLGQEGANEGDLIFMGDNNPGFWVVEYVDGVVINQASIKSGTVKFTRNSTGKTDDASSITTPTSYTLEIDGVERLGHSVKGTITFDATYHDLDNGGNAY